jgi:hypothetical protein
MSVMIAFRASIGSTAPNARPTIFSYWPVAPNDIPSNVGDSTRVISRRVIRASATAGSSESAAMTMSLSLVAFMVLPPVGRR